MNDNIIQFPVTTEGNQPEEEAFDVRELTWVCGCGCRSFNLFGDGELVCAACEVQVCGFPNKDGEWRKNNAPSSGEGLKDLEGVINQVDHQTDEFAKRSMIKKIEKWNKDGQLLSMIAHKKDGEGESWFNIHSEDERDELLQRLKIVINHLKSFKFGDKNGKDDL